MALAQGKTVLTLLLDVCPIVKQGRQSGLAAVHQRFGKSQRLTCGEKLGSICARIVDKVAAQGTGNKAEQRNQKEMHPLYIALIEC